jgi:hypothetical protein
MFFVFFQYLAAKLREGPLRREKEGDFNQKFLQGPGACFTFFQKKPLAAGGKKFSFYFLQYSR